MLIGVLVCFFGFPVFFLEKFYCQPWGTCNKVELCCLFRVPVLFNGIGSTGSLKGSWPASGRFLAKQESVLLQKEVFKYGCCLFRWKIGLFLSSVKYIWIRNKAFCWISVNSGSESRSITCFIMKEVKKWQITKNVINKKPNIFPLNRTFRLYEKPPVLQKALKTWNFLKKNFLFLETISTSRVGIKKPTQKNPPKKTQKNPPKKTH